MCSALLMCCIPILYSHSLCAQSECSIITIFWLLGRSWNGAVSVSRRLQKMPSKLSTAKGSFQQTQKQCDIYAKMYETIVWFYTICTMYLVQCTQTVHQLVCYVLTFMRLLVLAADCYCTTLCRKSSSLIPFICILNVLSFNFLPFVGFWRGTWMALMILYARCWQSWRNSNIFARHAIRWWRNRML